MTGSFAEYPHSINELRKDNNAATWTPREALVNLLRDIDRGEVEPTALVICIAEKGSQPGSVITTYRNVSGDLHQAVGLVEAVKLRIQLGGEED